MIEQRIYQSETKISLHATIVSNEIGGDLSWSFEKQGKPISKEDYFKAVAQYERKEPITA